MKCATIRRPVRESAEVRITERARVLEAAAAGANGEKVFKVVLISEGLGNRRNMNYYGPEAIESAVKAFEGKWCYLDHQSLEGETNLPERSVRDKAGYYKNLAVQTMEGKKCVVGELHCDMSESGRILAEKMASALHYQKEFPNTGNEYVGLSVNGDGSAERRDIDLDGDEVSANYVTAFTEGDSCDLVTSPARGGKGLAVLKEDEGGAVALLTKEASMKLLTDLKAALAGVNESAKEATGKAKARLLEAAKKIKAQIEAIEDEGGASMEAEVEALCAKREGEDDAAHSARLKSMHDLIGKKVGPAEADPNQDGDEHEPEGPSAESRREIKPAKLTADDLERNTVAVKALMAESGLPDGAYSADKIARLARLSFREAKAVIADDARLAEAVVNAVDAPVASLRGADRGGAAGDRTKTFTESLKEAR